MKRFLICLSAALLLLTGCSAPQPLRRSTVAMDTAVTVTLYDSADPSLIDGCFEMLKGYEALFSRTDPKSEIGRLNAAGGEEVPLSPETRELLAFGKEWGARTGGALDITVAPASSLWRFPDPVLPDEDALAEAAARVDWQALVLTDSGARLPAGHGVDLGAVAKGWASDRLADYLRKQGVTSALLDLGGNVYALGDKGGDPFTVGIRDPFDTDSLTAVVRVKDRAVVTSGVYERGFALEGTTYHHILDPATGWPVQNGLVSVTVLCPRAADADALSTGCFVLGLEKGMALIRDLPDTEALFITADGELHPSSGLEFEKR